MQILPKFGPLFAYLSKNFRKRLAYFIEKMLLEIIFFNRGNAFQIILFYCITVLYCTAGIGLLLDKMLQNFSYGENASKLAYFIEKMLPICVYLLKKLKTVSENLSFFMENTP